MEDLKKQIKATELAKGKDIRELKATGAQIQIPFHTVNSTLIERLNSTLVPSLNLQLIQILAKTIYWNSKKKGK